MSTVATLRKDQGVTRDPHGLKARMKRLGVTQRQVADFLGIAPNTVGRAVNTAEESDNRDRIVDYLDSLTPGRGPADEIVAVLGDREVRQLRAEMLPDGSLVLHVIAGRPGTTSAELQREVDRLYGRSGDAESSE